MLTPIEIQGKVFKSGIGYDKKDVDGFCREILLNYETLYKENVELADKISVLGEGIQYYKTIEKTLQNALILAEKTSDETKEAAKTRAAAIEKEARSKAKLIVADAKNELEKIHLQTINLVQQYDKYKVQFKKLAETQIEIINSASFNISIANLEAFSDTSEAYSEPQDAEETAIIDKSMEELKLDEKDAKERAAIRKAEIEEAVSKMEQYMEEPLGDPDTEDDFAEALSMENIFPGAIPAVAQEIPVKTASQTSKKYSDVKYYSREELKQKEPLESEKESEESKGISRSFEDLTVNLDDDDFDFVSYDD